MNQHIAQARDIPPWDFRILASERFRKTLDGLAEDLQPAQDSILGLRVLKKASFVETPGILFDPLDAREHILDV
jgi:hypothetical protein